MGGRTPRERNVYGPQSIDRVLYLLAGGMATQPDTPAKHDPSANPWDAPLFFRGHIPEEPPPAMYCH
jgi:hypothetical protein